MSEPLDAVTWPLRTGRLLLRRATAADEEALWSYRRLAEVSRWGSWHAEDSADFHAILLPRLRDQLVVEHEGRVVGDLVVEVEDAWAQREVRDHARGVQAELGWALAPAVAGQGFATEAVREVLRVCFRDLGLRRVTANAFAGNEASCRLAERVGMRRESYCVGESLHRDLGWDARPAPQRDPCGAGEARNGGRSRGTGRSSVGVPSRSPARPCGSPAYC